MPTNPLGSGVTRYITDKDRQYAAVVFQASKPPLDSELNLISLMELESRADEIRSRIPSGWLMNELSPKTDFYTNPTNSNQFYFGRNSASGGRDITWAIVNGWPIPVCGTATGSPPFAANNTEFWNRVRLNPPSESTGTNRADFVFLEVWLQRIDVDPPTGVAPGKPARGFIYRFGNVECGFSNLPDELVDPNINYETTKRVQIQYRIRVVDNVGISNYPEGFDPSLVRAQGALSAPSTIPFSNMGRELGDSGLWRAGTGDPITFGTADGYVYAIPISTVFRRNAVQFATNNLAGAFDRNSKALSLSDATRYTVPLTLQSLLPLSATSFNLTSVTGTVLETITTDFTEACFRIDDEIIRVTSITGSAPAITVSIERGFYNTEPRDHAAGSLLTSYTIRPDGLFSDQVAATDILDMRHSVADKFDYDSILKTNVIELLKGNLNTAWKSYGSNTSRGAVTFYGDSVSSSVLTGLNKLESPDGNRKTWSDAVVTQRFVVPVTVPDDSSALNDNLAFDIDPYNMTVAWVAAAALHPVGPSRLVGSTPYWFNGDAIAVRLASFTSTGNAKFVLPDGAYIDSVLIRFEGMTSDPHGGAPTLLNATSPTTPSATNPLLTPPILSTSQILKEGSGITVTKATSLTPNAFEGDLLITFTGAGDQVTQFVDALQGATGITAAQNYKMWLEFTVVYSPGQGLAYKPDWIHTAQFSGSTINNSTVLVRSGLSGQLYPLAPTYLSDSPLVQTGNNRALARTSELMVDPGSKSINLAPYTYQRLPALVARNGNNLNWYFTNPNNIGSIVYQGGMPTRSANDYSVIVHSVVDPLNLFYDGTSDCRYVEISNDLLPKPGFHSVPIMAVKATNYTYFSSGLNFMIDSKQGVLSASEFFNRNIVSYPTSAPGYYVVTRKPSDPPYGSAATVPSPISAFGEKVAITKVVKPDGQVFTGIKFPPFYGPARITGVYQRLGIEVVPVSSPFNNERVYTPGPGSSVNLLRDNFLGPTFLLDVDNNGDLYFILNSDALNLSLISGFSGNFFDYDFLVECTLFGYDRGFLQTNGRFFVSRNNPIAVNSFTEAPVGIVTPAPLAADRTVSVFYSRTPYQGNVFGTQGGYADAYPLKGSISQADAKSIYDNPLGPVPSLTLPNKFGYEILSAVSFSTDLGTGRLSGSNPIPLLNSVEAPSNPVDYPDSRIDLNRRYSLNRVGYEDIAAANIRYPVKQPVIGSPPDVKLGALSEIFDNDVHPELAGSTSRLPLGSYFRDKDFLGKTLYQSRSANGNAAIPVGTLSFFEYEASMTQGIPGLSTWEGTEWVCGNSSNASGVGSEAIVKVDGVDPGVVGGTSAYTSTTVFKTARGGAAYSATGPWPGGVITSRFPKTRPNLDVGAVLNATAYLVRSAPEVVSGIELHPGNELQMIIVTQVAPSYFKDNEIVHSASGANEGFTAVDRYRVFGKPLEKRRAHVNVNVLPSGKPLFVNKIYDNPLLYGSADLPLISIKQETASPVVNNQTQFILSEIPASATSVQMFLNGVKLNYGFDYTVGGPNNTIVTYLPLPWVKPPIISTDVIEFWYVIY